MRADFGRRETVDGREITGIHRRRDAGFHQKNQGSLFLTLGSRDQDLDGQGWVSEPKCAEFLALGTPPDGRVEPLRVATAASSQEASPAPQLIVAGDESLGRAVGGDDAAFVVGDDGSHRDSIHQVLQFRTATLARRSRRWAPRARLTGSTSGTIPTGIESVSPSAVVRT